MNYLFGVPRGLSLHCIVGNQKKIPNELNVQTSAAISLKLTKQFYPIQYPTNNIDPVLSYTIPFMFMNNS